MMAPGDSNVEERAETTDAESDGRYRAVVEALRSSEGRYRRIIEGLTDYQYSVRVENGRAVETVQSPACVSVTGYTAEEFAEDPYLWINMVALEHRDMVRNRVEQILAGMEISSFEHRITRKDGEDRWVVDTIIPYKDSSGKLLAYDGVIKDITALKRAEQAKLESDVKLRESRQYLQAVLDASNDAFFVDDADTGCIIDVNQRMCEMYGYTREEAVSLSVGALSQGHPPWSQAEAMAWLKKAREDGPQTFEWLAKRKSGELFWSEVSIRHSLFESGGRFVVTVRDISSRKKVEAEAASIETQNRQLQKAESLSRMAGAIAHHFNNQLQTVILSLDLARMSLARGAMTPESLDEAAQAARRAAEVSSLMLTYLGQTQGRLEALDFADICRQALPLLQLSMPKRVELKTNLPLPGPVIQGNAGQIRQILDNLLTNAWEAVGENCGVIHLIVRTSAPDDIPKKNRFPIGWLPQKSRYACLEIADTGIGIANSDVDKIFDPFFSSKFAGRGLGLAVVLGIARAHSGVVTVSSEPGLGSVFRVFLPVDAAAVVRPPIKPVDAAHPPASKDSELSKGTILLAEDEASLRKVASNALKGLGFNVLTAKDGAEAVELFHAHRSEIRLVVCDLTMPRMDGWETIAALRRLEPCIPVILTSGYDETRAMAGNHPEKPQAFLCKPYEFEVFCETVFRVLNEQTKTHQ